MIIAAATIDGRPQDLAVPALDGEGPLWLQIRRSLAWPILTGAWLAGTRFPTELALTDHYATSRMTVNKAILSLATEGLVERRPRLGTVVTGRARERPVVEIWDPADAVRRAGGRYGYRLLARETLPPGSPMRAGLDVTEATPIVRLLCLHAADGRPFQLEERLVNVAAAPGIVDQPLVDVGPGPWLMAHVPWTEAHHSISARGATATVAAHLELAPGTACLVIGRRTWNGAVPITTGSFWYPGDEYSVEGRFRPSW